MASALIYLFVALVVGAVVFLLASVVFGRGEQLESLPPGATPTRLPAADIDGSDLRKLRFQQVVRGYKAAEVDWALERAAGELDTLRGRVAVLERQLEAADEQLRTVGATGVSEDVERIEDETGVAETDIIDANGAQQGPPPDAESDAEPGPDAGVDTDRAEWS